MDWLANLNLTPDQIGLATLITLIAGGIFAGWARVFGKKEGPPQPKVQEFYAGGALADMGPVKELVEQTGLLIQQQVRTNVVLERLAAAYEEHLREEATQEEIEKKAQDLFERRLAQERQKEDDDTRPRRPRA